MLHVSIAGFPRPLPNQSLYLWTTSTTRQTFVPSPTRVELFGGALLSYLVPGTK